jgi:PAS domain S-box-containing protein
MYNEKIYSHHDLAADNDKERLKYFNTLDELYEGIAIINFEWKYIYVNDSYARQLQSTRDKFIGHTIFELVHVSKSSLIFNTVCKDVLQNHIPLKVETHYKFCDTSEHWFKVHVSPVPEGILIQSQDITENKIAENRIHELTELSENRLAELKAVIESIPDSVLIGNKDGIIQCNTRALNLLGFDSLEDFKGGIGVLSKKINTRHPDSGIPFAIEENLLVRALKGETSEEDILFTNQKTGLDTIIRCASAPVIRDGKIIYAIIVESDITERKQKEYSINASLNDKEILLRELYHRSKNNLTVISSLLSLKAQELEDEEMITILNDMTHRIRTIGEIHDLLHKSNSHEMVNLNTYITQIVNRLINSFAEKTDKILLKTELEDVIVHIDTAISCGLVVNELITNSFKYAFPGNMNGEIEIRLLKHQDTIELNISDNGVGFTEKDVSEGHLGLKVFNLIAQDQLNAETDIKIKNGVSVSIRFMDNQYEIKKSGIKT